MAKSFRINLIYITIEILSLVSSIVLQNNSLIIMCLVIQVTHLISLLVAMKKVLTGFKNKNLEDIADMFPMVADLLKNFEEDKVTGCTNRITFEHLRGKYERRKNIVVAFFDVNGLKVVNDTYGHEMGDLLLKRTGDIIKELVCFGDVYRWGGDEFVFIAVDVDVVDTLTKLDSWYKAVGFRKTAFGDRDIPLQFAMGTAFKLNEEPYKIEDLVKEADKNMYLVKNELKREFEDVERKK